MNKRFESNQSQWIGHNIEDGCRVRKIVLRNYDPLTGWAIVVKLAIVLVIVKEIRPKAGGKE